MIHVSDQCITISFSIIPYERDKFVRFLILEDLYLNGILRKTILVLYSSNYTIERDIYFINAQIKAYIVEG